MLKLTTLAIFSFVFSAYGRAPSTYSQIKSDLLKTSQPDLIRVLNEFVKAGAPSRMVSLPGHDKARDFILASIKAHDPKGSGKLIVDTFSPDVEEAKRFYQNDFDQKVEEKFQGFIPITRSGLNLRPT